MDDLYAPDDLPETRQLRDTMAFMEEQIATIDPEDECDEQMQAQMQALCAADGAPLEWVSILGRVKRGTQTWQRVWHEPREEEGAAGVALVRAALTASTTADLLGLSAVEESFLESVDEYNRQRIKRN